MPAHQALGVTDGDIPMTTISLRLPVGWLKKLRTVAHSQKSSSSELIRAGIVLWAMENQINLYQL